MNELESLQSRLRESQMRLREVRTENGVLKIQYRRWLYTAVGISMASMVICVFILLFESDPLADIKQPHRPNSQQDTQEVAHTILDEDPLALDDPIIDDVPQPLSTPDTDSEPISEGSSSLDGLEMPGWDEEEDSKIDEGSQTQGEVETTQPPAEVTPSQPDTFELPKPQPSPTVQPPTTGFALPGASSKRTVIQHKVVKRDTLWEIVKRYKGSPPTPRLIQKVMKDNGLRSSRIQPGSELIIILDNP